MKETDLSSCAEQNRKVFDRVLPGYVSTKLEQMLTRLPRGERSGWFDASGCVWCLFDAEAFARSGDQGRHLRDEAGDASPVQVYWSMEDVVMPRGATSAGSPSASPQRRCDSSARKGIGARPRSARPRARRIWGCAFAGGCCPGEPHV